MRQTLLSLIRAFDIDILAGQSYALFPVGSGDLRALAGQLQGVFGAKGEGPLSDVVQVLPMEHVNAILVIASQPRYIAEAQRFFQLANRVETATARAWHVYYVQNGQSADLEILLQRAFTPTHVSPSPAPPGSTAPGAMPVSMNAGGAAGGGAGAIPGGGAQPGGGLGGQPSGGLGGLSRGGAGGAFGAPGAPPGGPRPGDNPAAEALSASGGGEKEENRVRILANRRNNALLIFATPAEYAVIEGMLRKIDIIPLQVLIEATIAEVTLSDTLKYGTQFFLKQGKFAATLSQSVTSAFANNFPGFVLTHGADAAINALSDVTRVRVLSSPQVMVLDNEPARLQVGSLVPVLTGSAQSIQAPGAPIVNNINYRETGVIMQVVPHVNSGGLVTLDIGQEVSDVAAQTTLGIQSPTFSERLVQTRVAIQDGQTIGMAGLIRDVANEENSGIPFLKDIPLIGLITGSQDDARTRTELLVMLTPHVVRDQRDARALTEDLRRQLINAAIVPRALARKPLSGSPEPFRR